MGARAFEIIVVDDSSEDGTRAVCARLAERFPLRLIVRVRENGLSGAVLCGLREARGELLVVMDADLQHPPENISDLLIPLERDEADFAIGSRYAAGGSLGRVVLASTIEFKGSDASGEAVRRRDA